MRLATLRGPEAAVTSRRRMLGGMAALVLLPLPGCGLLPRVNEPVNLYTLTPKTTFSETLPNVDWQLVVETPVAAVSLDTPRIALQRTPLTFEYYANAAWTDNAPAMVQTLLIESFESTNVVEAVGREAIGLRPDYVLKTDLREFQSIYDGDKPVPDVWVRMNAKMVQMPERRIVASETFGHRQSAGGAKLPEIVAAFDDALGNVLKAIVLFSLAVPPRQS